MIVEHLGGAHLVHEALHAESSLLTHPEDPVGRVQPPKASAGQQAALNAGQNQKSLVDNEKLVNVSP